MKKILMIIAIICMTLVFKVGAVSCPYSETHELNSEVAHVKIKYSIKTAEYDSSMYGCDGAPENCDNATYDYFDVSILNMSDKFYVEITNNYNDDVLTLHYYDADEDGILHFNHEYIMEKVTYTFTFYASDQTSCERSKIKTYTKAFPRKNLNHYEAICDDLPEADICQEYVFFDEMEYKTFYKVATKEKAKIEEKKEKTKKKVNRSFVDEVIDFVVDNKWYFIGSVGVIVIAGAFITLKKRKGDE